MNMRTVFPGYYRPSLKEYKQLWDEGLVTLDANVLLDLYRYSEKTREEVFTILEWFGDRLWTTRQAALEFQRNRPTVLVEQSRFFQRARDSVASALHRIRQEMSPYRYHPGMEYLTGKMKELMNFFEGDAKTRYPTLKAEDLLGSDEVRERIEHLIGDRLGTQPADLDPWYSKARERYRKRIPPGYEDEKKPEPEKFGDALLWFEILEKVKVDGRPLLLVTGDTKEDWWLIAEGATIGPRPELRDELRSQTDVPFYMYNTLRFLEVGGHHAGRKVSEDAREEVRDIQTAERSHAGVSLMDMLRESESPHRRRGDRTDPEATRQTAENLKAIIDLIRRIQRSPDSESEGEGGSAESPESDAGE